MKHAILSVPATLVVLLAVSNASATVRIRGDIEGFSPSKKLKVEAKSPDNKDGQDALMQGDFVYTCTDLTANRVLWTRRQDARQGKNGRTEASPAIVCVSDSGWTTIATGHDELIAVNPKGKDHAYVDILSEGLTRDDREKYVQYGSGGPSWGGCSHWYFARDGAKEFFVVRTWWGRRVVLDLQLGRLVDVNPQLTSVLALRERDLVLETLKEGPRAVRRWEETGESDQLCDMMPAAHLAGVLRVKEAAPLLRRLEGCRYIGSYTSSPSAYEPREGRVSAGDYRKLPVRQVAQLSLRRLGEKPGAFPAIWPDIHSTKSDEQNNHEPPTPNKPRAEGVDGLKRGMTPEEVISLVGAPDFVLPSEDTDWCYDIDDAKPYTLTVRWGKKGVEEIKKHRPAFWKAETWDQEIAQ